MPAGAPPGGGEMPSYMATMLLIGGILELVGGAAVLLGLFNRPVAFILAGECAVIFWMMHVPMGGIFPILNGGESAVLFCFTFLYLVFADPGAFAIDNLLGRKTAAT
jgi:putative oxidoreductase